METKDGMTRIEIRFQQDPLRQPKLQPREFVVVIDESPAQAWTPTKCAHHRRYPEIRGEGGTVHESVLQLAFQLARAREHATELWQLEEIEDAIQDVTAYQASKPEN